jgi:hypothetical protein
MRLIAGLRGAYGISNCNVLTQSDLRPGQTTDVGPMFDWRGAYSRFSVGFHPGFPPPIRMDVKRVTDKVCFGIIRALGYQGAEPDIVQAYKLHFLQDELSPELTDRFRLQLLWHARELNEAQDRNDYFDSHWTDLTFRNSELLQIMSELESLLQEGASPE